jgi:hypothetical protein
MPTGAAAVAEEASSLRLTFRNSFKGLLVSRTSDAPPTAVQNQGLVSDRYDTGRYFPAS